MVGRGVQRIQCAPHREVGGPQDIQPVNFEVVCAGNCPTNGWVSGQVVEQFLASESGDLFGIIQSIAEETAWQHDGGGGDWSSQGASPRLVHARDPKSAADVVGVFEGKVGHRKGRELKPAKPLMIRQLGCIGGGEKLGAEDHAIVIDYNTNPGMGPRRAHVVFVPFRISPHSDQCWAGRFSDIGGGGDVLAEIGHAVAFAGNQHPAIKADVADIFTIQSERSAIFPQVFTVFLGQPVETGVTL